MSEKEDKKGNENKNKEEKENEENKEKRGPNQMRFTKKGKEFIKRFFRI